MNISEIAREAVDEFTQLYINPYDKLGTVAYHQTITDIANHAWEDWQYALFVAFEAAIEEDMRKRGYAPTD